MQQKAESQGTNTQVWGTQEDTQSNKVKSWLLNKPVLLPYRAPVDQDPRPTHVNFHK